MPVLAQLTCGQQLTFASGGVASHDKATRGTDVGIVYSGIFGRDGREIPTREPLHVPTLHAMRPKR
jgi:nicotinamide mononucleotide (NMN) deamidase PncC